MTQAQTPGPKVGLFDDIDNETYHRGPGISKSGLDLISRSPAHYIEMKRHPKPPTPAMVLGTAFHAIVLEPDTFDDLFVPDPYPGSYAKAAKEAREQLVADGKTIVQTGKDVGHWGKDDWRAIHNMRDAVIAHPVASILLNPNGGKAEQTCYWIDPETRKLCKARPDFISDAHNLCIDLKSTEDASYTEFTRSVSKWRYHLQSVWYRTGLYRVERPVTAFVFVVVEKTPPYGVALYVLDKEADRIGAIQAEHDLALYAQCHNDNEWPTYPEEVRDLRLSEWQLRGKIS